MFCARRLFVENMSRNRIINFCMTSLSFRVSILRHLALLTAKIIMIFRLTKKNREKRMKNV